MFTKFFFILLHSAFSTALGLDDHSIDLEDQLPIGLHSDNVLAEVFSNEVNQTSQIVGNNTQKYLPPVIQGGEAVDPQTRARRNYVREMMRHAWSGYVAHAWGKNEVRPVSKSGNLGTVFGSSACGATIVDSMDTLYIMGMEEEFAMGREWISTNLNLTLMTESISVFETNIRYVGGLLTAFAFTGDDLFKSKAVEIVDLLLPAFSTPTGVPHGKVNMQTGQARSDAGLAVLSEFGTLHMEFSYLSDITGNPVYKEKVEILRDFLDNKQKDNNLYPNYLNPVTGQWGQNIISMGAMGDSFYEYLIKEWLRSGKTDKQAKKMFDEAVVGIEENLLQISSQGQTYLADLKGGMLEHKMDHLACFAGGMFALAAVEEEEDVRRRQLMKMAEGITSTCQNSYNETITKLGPEVIRFDNKPSDSKYLLRPETVESFFIMWRLTKDPKYREWGWKVVQALELNCKVDGGYSGIRNVNVRLNKATDDVQQSFFLAETLKYLYLLFSEDHLIDLNQWVFNTEAHPLPVKGANTFYRASISSDRTKILHSEL